MSTTQRRFGYILGITVLALAASVVSPAASVAADDIDEILVEVDLDGGNPTPDIVGGTEATPGEYPFAVDIELAIYASYSRWSPIFDRFETYSINVFRKCAGSLFDDEWVLTAAHCFNSVEIDDSSYPYGTFRGSVHVDDLELHVGRHDLTTGAGETFSASAVFVHPDYTDETSAPYDIALVRLDGSSAYSPVELATTANAGLYSGGTTATAIGWGHTSQGGSSSDVLMEVAIPTLSDATCSFIHGSDFIPSIELCAGDIYNGGEDTCQGDSGGPILVPGGSGWLQAGVTSWGIGCATIVPGVYTEVAAFRDWIDETMSITPFVAAEPVAAEFDPTGSHLVYWVDNESGERAPYSIPIGGGTPVALGTPTQAYQDGVAFTSDGSTLVYGVVDAYTGTGMDIFTVPVAGPDSSRVTLVEDLPWGDDRYDWMLSPNDSEIFYRTDFEGDMQWHLYRVSLADGTRSPVSGAMIAYGDVTGFD
ncbi:MAG: serine protease, partial [Acidimicrobiia bacterium]|nr:serine protease [Acidimicrobiia bacterium]